MPLRLQDEGSLRAVPEMWRVRRTSEQCQRSECPSLVVPQSKGKCPVDYDLLVINVGLLIFHISVLDLDQLLISLKH